MANLGLTKTIRDLSLLLRTTAVPYPQSTMIWQKDPSDSDEPFFLSTRPEDRGFALLAMAHDSLDLGIVPDYTKGVQDVYVNTARTIIQANQDLGLLSFCQSHKNRVETSQLGTGLDGVCRRCSVQPVSAATRCNQLAMALLSMSRNVVPDISFPDDTTLTLSEMLVDVADSTLRVQSYYPSSSVVDSDAFVVMEKVKDFVVSALDFISQSANKGGGGPQDHTSKLYRDHAHEIICGLMTSQLQGSIKHGVEEYVPFVLRPVRKDGREGCYEIVGEAFMYGMMEGEFMWTSPETREFALV